MEDIGEQFQRSTGYSRGRMPVGHRWRDAAPELYKSYSEAAVVDLPAVSEPKSLSVYEAIRRRRSVRRYAERPLRLEELSWLLWASTGITRTERGYEFRAAPSAGALYPIETYLCVNRVDGLAPGLYHYAVDRHKLHVLREGIFRQAIAAAALDQGMCSAAPVVFVWSAMFGRSMVKYGQRGIRYVYMDAGHIAENLALAAVSVGLATCQIAALYDDESNRLFDLDGRGESIIYMTTVGAV